MDINKEEEKLSVLRAENEAAQSDYLRQLERDTNRRDGSQRQDSLSEKILRESQDKARETEAAVIAQEKVLAELSAG